MSDTPGQLDNRGRATASPEAPSIEHGNRMLSFQFPSYHYTILDASRCPTSLSLTAQLHGMFFLAESSRTSSGDGMSPPIELTCYRRNLFQITGCITLPQMMRYVLTEHGEPISIASQELCVSASESVEGNPIKIISVPWKTPANGQTSVPEEKTEKEPTSIVLQRPADQYSEDDYVKIPIEWKRLQFRVATANNGRRKELQQHFIIKLAVVVTLATGEKLTVCDTLSGPIIVRGRSPRNFSQRRDFPLSGSGGSLRKAMQSNSRHRTASPDVLSHRHSRSRASSAVPPSFSRHHSPSLSQSRGFVNWTEINTNVSHMANSASTSPQEMLYSSRSPESANSTQQMMKRKAGSPGSSSVNSFSLYDSPHLSIPNDRPSKAARSVHNSPSPDQESVFMPFATSAADFSQNPSYHNMLSSPSINSSDLVNKFLPSGLEDWMPPTSLGDMEPMFKREGHQNFFQQPHILSVGGGMGWRSHKRYASDSVI